MYGEVIAVEMIAPRMKRVTLGGPGLAEFETTGLTDEYVNALFIPDGATFSVPFELDVVRSLDPQQRPRGRRYTIRSVDPQRGQICIDFVVHGDVGFAGRWANRARVGDRLQLIGPSGGYSPAADADWYLMVGDESALPAIGRSLEALDKGSQVIAVVVVDDAKSEIDLACPANASFHWVHRDDHADANGSVAARLTELLATQTWPSSHPDVFVHGEAEEVRAVRHHLVLERGLDRVGWSLSPYWRRGQSDEAWRDIKSQWIAEMEADQ